RRNPGWAAALGTVFALLLVIAVGSALAAAWFAEERRKARLAEKEATEQREAAEENLGRAERAERDQRANLWQSSFSEAWARGYSHRSGQRFEGLAALRAAARIRRDGRLRDLASTALALEDVRPARAHPAFPRGVTWVTFDDAYRLYASLAEKGTLLVRRVADHRIVHRLPVQTTPEHVRFGPDGRLLGVSGNGLLTVWRLEDGRQIVRAPLGRPFSFAFRPDSRQVAIAAAGAISLFDLATGKQLKQFPLSAVAHWLAWTPDGRRLAVGH